MEAPPPDTPAELNAAVWSRGEFVDEYADDSLRAVEAIILLRYRDALSGRVLELGSGAGRLTRCLLEVAREVHGLDIAPPMVERARQELPAGTFHEGDMRDLSRFGDGSFDAVVAPFNVLDVFGDDQRSAVLDGIARVVAPGGHFVLSTHNRGYVPNVRKPIEQVRTRNPLKAAVDLLRLPRRMRNRRRVQPLEKERPGYALVNDEAHDYALLHYYISRDAEARQLAQHGFELLACFDLQGREVGPGEAARGCAELHYVARKG